MATFVQEGAAVDYTPTADTPAGSVIVQVDLIGIAKHNIKANTLGAISVEGVFDIDKVSADAITAGSKIYWDATVGKAVTTATGNKQLGKAISDAGAGKTTVRVRLSQ